ncbi:MAG: ATP-binding protein [Bacteroidota bacterium]|nr:ATP-binding protein [Candidatus Kapabacteria bacterium]MDW8220650.1 ATP-binding protein [Bacteroidota bacterium]
MVASIPKQKSSASDDNTTTDSICHHCRKNPPMTSWFSNLSIRAKLLGIILFCTISALAIGFTLVSISNVRALKRDMVRNTAVLAQVIGDNNIGALAFRSPQESEESLGRLSAIASVRYACIYDGDNKLFAEYIRPDQQAYINREGILPASIMIDSLTRTFSEFRDDELVLYQQIFWKDDHVGTVLLRVSTRELETRIQSYGIMMTGVALAITLASLMLALWLQRFISARILSLAGFMRSLSETNDFSERFEQHGGNDEIGTLTRGFNNLLDQLQRRELERDKARAALEAALREDFRETVRNLQNLVIKAYKAPNGEYLVSLFEGRIAANFGLDTEAVRGKSLGEIFGRKMQALYQKYFDAAFQGRTVRFESELNGVTYLNFLVPIIDDGRIREVVCSTVDISSQKEAEMRLRVSEQRYRALIQGLPVGIIQSVRDEKGLHVELVNDEFINLTGFSMEMLAEMQWGEGIQLPIYEQDREAAESAWKAWITNDTDTFLHRTYRLQVMKDTRQSHAATLEYRWFDDYATKLRLDSGEILIIQALTDIHEKKQSEVQLQLSLDKERQVNELKTRFVSTVSHEFRTPLAGMLLSVDMLTRYFDRLTPEKRIDELNKIRVRINELTDLMNDFLAQSESQSIVGRFKPAPIEISELVKQMNSEMEFIASATSRSRIQRTIDVPEGCIINGDMKLLRYVIRNLLSNAIKYSAKDTPVMVEIRCVEHWLEIAVSDQGIGIPANELDKLFTPFFRASNTTTISGTGVGLSIVKEFVEAHGGTISVQTQQHVGSTFTVRLPLAERVIVQENGALN